MSAEVCLSRQRGLKGVKHLAHFYRIVTLVFACSSDVVLDARPRPRGALRPIFIGLALHRDQWPWPWPRDQWPWPWPWPQTSLALALKAACIDNFFHHLQMQEER